jgi:hypothetical protein
MRYYAILIGGGGGPVDPSILARGGISPSIPIAAPNVFPVVPGSYIPGAQFSSVAYGQNDPGALRCEMYIEQQFGHIPIRNSFVRLWGVSLDQISQSHNLTGQSIEVHGGMWPGLPLATEQSNYKGRLVSGIIQASFGNWQGADMSLDLLISGGVPGTTMGVGAGAQGGSNPPSPGQPAPSSRLLTRRSRRYSNSLGSISPSAIPSPVPQDIGDIISASGLAGFSGILNTIANTFGGGGWNLTPANLIHNLLPNMPLSSAIQQTLSTAFPGSNVSINISPLLKLAYQDSSFHQSVQQIASYWKQLSHSINPDPGYAGILTWLDGNTVKITDLSQGEAKVTKINYVDIIGQVTWLSLTQINLKTVMRADINPSDWIVLDPNTPVAIALPADTSLIGGYTLQSLTLGFSGAFWVTSVTHVGDSRHPDGAQWCTVIVANVAGSLSSNLVKDAITGITNIVSSVGSSISSIFGGAAPQSQKTGRTFRRAVRRYG